ncbi:hypothetical protein SAY87_024475 [Trapa incisa]|uniref:Protein kinase domain-containing protein n=1 Tax=Trapa incisa TaxID=236973 RepID=A0AAN7JFG1_9MYRT|nr:hypothetical protein SAY87_024475 [Trapa incisa]
MAEFQRLCLAIFMLHLSVPVIASPVIETEALLQFKSLLEDPLNALESWKPGSGSPCGFLGVTCDMTMENVLHVSLENLSISGRISPSISKLRSLTSLSLASNFITGKLPHEIANCSNLRILNLTRNEMVGNLPDLSRLQNLQVLDLSANYFTGEVPRWVGNLTGLASLVLGDNDYDEGEIPVSIGNLKKMRWLYLGQSRLRGEIPNEIFQLSSLQILDMSINRISGNLSKSISSLHNLVKLELFANMLTGEIPPELANLTFLQEVDISANKFYGKLPAEIGNMEMLRIFQCYENDFSGELPQGFSNSRNLIVLSIYKNNFSGNFPVNLGRFSPLEGIDISENQFSSEFPRFLCQNRKLRFLLAVENNFYGNFPDSYADCKSLERLRVTWNHLSGTVADGVWALPNVKMIDFGSNQFSGRIPSSVRYSTNLEQLVLQKNRFSGELPVEISQLRNLQRLYLNNNNFSGIIPPEFGNLRQLWSLHLEANSITGHIPPELSRCTKLVDLNLALNSLSGEIPTSISSMSSLNSLNISGNQLVGLIPESLNKLKLSSIDLSQNRLSVGLLITSYRNFKLVEGGIHDQEKGDFLRQDKKPDNDMIKWKFTSFHQVEIDAEEICNLEEANLIGSGGTGQVYRLELKKSCGNLTVAVKQLKEEAGVEPSLMEVETLGKIRHRNILKLYACLIKGGSGYLVFEYMANGTLFQALHGPLKGKLPKLDCRENALMLLDAEVVSGLNKEDMIKVLKVAVLCTSIQPSLRPTMKDVVKMLEDADPFSFRSSDEGEDDRICFYNEIKVRCSGIKSSLSITGCKGILPFGTDPENANKLIVACAIHAFSLCVVRSKRIHSYWLNKWNHKSPWILINMKGGAEGRHNRDAISLSDESSKRVRLHVREKHVVMDNGILQVTISKPQGTVSEVHYNGIINLLETRNDEGNRGYWDLVWNLAGTSGTAGFDDRIIGTSFNIIVDNDDQAEISFTRMYDESQEGKMVPLNIDIRFVMLRNCSGFYSYGIYEHLKEWPAFNLPQTRIVFKLKKDKFHYMAVADNRQRYMPLPDDRLPDRGESLAIPEAVLLVDPVEPEFKGEVDDKYQYSCENMDLQVHGWICTDSPVGFWQITPSNEFRSGGLLKQNLTSHVGPTTLAVSNPKY